MLKKNKKYFIGALITVAVVIIFAYVSDNYIFGYNPNSRSTADAWAGFWGGCLGALIGALATIIAVTMQIKDTKEQSKNDEEKRLRPFFHIQVDDIDGATDIKKSHNQMFGSQNLIITNIGLHVACMIRIYQLCDGKENPMPINRDIVMANEFITLPIYAISYIDSCDSLLLCFHDIIGNQYKQKIKINYDKEEVILKNAHEEIGPIERIRITNCVSDFPVKQKYLFQNEK